MQADQPRPLDEIIAEVSERVDRERAERLTPEEIKNGWTVESLAAHRRRVNRGLPEGGNVVVVMSGPRPKPPVRVENCKNWNPFERKWIGK